MFISCIHSFGLKFNFSNELHTILSWRKIHFVRYAQKRIKTLCRPNHFLPHQHIISSRTFRNINLSSEGSRRCQEIALYYKIKLYMAFKQTKYCYLEQLLNQEICEPLQATIIILLCVRRFYAVLRCSLCAKILCRFEVQLSPPSGQPRKASLQCLSYFLFYLRQTQPMVAVHDLRSFEESPKWSFYKHKE